MRTAWGFAAAILLTLGGLAATGAVFSGIVAVVVGRSDPRHGAGVVWALALALGAVALVTLPLGWLAARAARKPAA